MSISRTTLRLTLKEKNLLFKTAENIAQVGHWKHDMQTNSLYWSDETYRIHNVKKGKYIPLFSEVLHLYHPEDREKVKQIAEQVKKNGAYFNYMARLINEENKIKYVQVYGKGNFNSEGKVISLIGVIYDITRITQKEHDVNEMNAFLKTVLNSIPDPLLVKDRNSIITMANNAYRDLFSSSTQLIGSKGEIGWSKDFVEEYRQKDKEAFEKGYSEWYMNFSHPKNNESHDYFTKRIRFENEKGESFLLGIARDITALKQTQLQLEESEKRYQLAMSGSQAAIYDWNITEDTLFWSPQFKAYLGLDPHFVPSWTKFTEKVHPDDLPYVVKAINEHLYERKPCDVELRMQHVDQEYLWFHGRGQAVWDEEGKPIRMVGSLINITGKKNSELILKELYTLNIASNLALKDTMLKVLSVAGNYYKADLVIIGEIEEYTYKIAYFKSVEDTLFGDISFDLNQTYCLETFNENKITYS